ncbi:MAG: MMPL family transporter [Deltaproteobacteria bacterium]|nr:MMPL family transporter [Deltaproteobacteria bacterium]
MAHQLDDRVDDYPIISDLKHFDRSSGVLLERLIFNWRWLVVTGCALVTLVLGFMATKLVLNASFDKMIPHSHPYIKNYLANRSEIQGLGNALYIVVENTQGDIFDPQYLDLLMKVSDEVLLIPGVDRPWMKSLWTPGVRYTEITEEGFVGGPVMPSTYDGSPASLEKLRHHIARAGLVGKLVGSDYQSSMVFVPLVEMDAQTGKRLDYSVLSQRIEKVREKYEAEGKGKIKIHVTGFAKIVGDLLAGMRQMLFFFAIAVVICGVVVFLYTRCVRSTVVLIFCALVAVLWQLGIVAALGYELDPYQILVPFLVFAIGASHGAQKMNGIMQDIGRGTHKLVAARYTFRRLFMAGLTAILADAVSFAVLMLIDIPVIRDLVMTASIGVAILVFSKLILLPVILSFTGVSPSAAKRSLAEDAEETKGKGFGKVWAFCDLFTRPGWAVGAIAAAAGVTVVAVVAAHGLQIGDVNPGAPELRPDSRYNRDVTYINSKYGLSSDQFAVLVKTPPDGLLQYPAQVEIDRLSWALKQVPGVQNVISMADMVAQVTAGTYEASPKWMTIARNQDVLNYGMGRVIESSPDMMNAAGTVTPVIAYLSDHKAATLERVAAAAEAFAQAHGDKDRQFLLAAGTSGIEAATNAVVKETNRTMMYWVYAVVSLLCLITFRSWRATLVAMIPLVITSILCEAIMVELDIGVKVATLPVIALGVGIGVDYALYLLAVQIAFQRHGLTLSQAYQRSLRFTGKVVCLVGLTMAAAVVTWAWSPIKFQADMGILLTFMFVWNMIGALILIPALSRFLLNRVKVTIPAALASAEAVPAISSERL